jgi:hypothetical protein
MPVNLAVGVALAGVMLLVGCGPRSNGLKAKQDAAPRTARVQDAAEWGLGPYCDKDSDCRPGQRCLEVGGEAGGFSACFRHCESDAACPKGQVCVCEGPGCTYSWSTAASGTNFCIRGPTPEQKRLEEEMGPKRRG